MSPSPIGTLTLTASGLDDCLSNKYKMNILSNQENNVKTFNLNSSDLSFDTDSPEISQSPSNYSSQSSLTCSPKKISSVTKSIDIKNTSNGCIKNMFENTIQTPTSNDMLFESLNSASFSLSFDKISNSSFMDYFNLPESYSVSPSINYNLSINNAGELKENEAGNCCLYSISNNNDVKMRKKKISFSSNNCLFPNFDDFDLNFDQCDTKNASENVKFLEQHDDDKLKAEKLLELNDLSVDDSDEINQIDNHDTLIAIREMAILERRSQQRKHKNSTSSVSSASMSSRIKKFAIDLQNTTSNVTLDNQNFKPVPIYTSNSNNTNAPKSSFKIEYLLNSLPDHDGLFANDLDIDRFNIDVDDTDLSQILELEGWEQMLDEDCISRLTTDFSNQNFLTKRSIDETNRNSDNSEKHNDQSNFQARNQAVNEIKIDSSETNEVLKSSNNSINCDQVDSNSNFKMLSSNSIPAYLKLPTRPVLNSTTSISRIQNMSNTTKKSQPVVVVLSSASSSKVGNKSSLLSAAAGVSPNETKSSNQSKQINIENKTSKIQILNSIKNNNSLNQSLTITNNQIKRLNISENFNESSIKNKEKIFFSKQTQENGETLDKTDLKKTNVKNALNNNTDTESKMHCGNVTKLDGDASTSMPSSLIDPIIEIIDCINPDQIFPTRTANKKDDSSGIDSVKSWTKTSTYLENNLKTENFDEEDDEEIDVVSINQNNNNNCLNFNNNNNSDLKTKNNTELRGNNFIKNKETTLDHHNYFNQPSTLAVQSNNITGNRKTQMNFQNKTGSQPSLLAKCLKSTNSNNDIFTKQDFSNKYSKNFTILGEKKQILSSLSETTNFNESNNSFKVSDGVGDFKNSLVNNSNTPISSISKSLSSPVLKKSANLLFNTVNLDQSRKNSIFSSSNNFLSNTSPNITENNPSARNLSQKSLTNPIRILTTSINNSNSAIRQINQTTTLCSNQNILANSSINKGKLSNIIHIPTQSISNNNNLFNNSVGNLSNTFTKNCKNSNKSETKIFTTTLIAKHQNVNKITNSTSFKRISSNFKNFSVKNENKNENTSILEVKSNDANLETRIIDDQTNNLLFEKCEISTDYDFDINQTKNIEDNVNDNESNKITDESDEDYDEENDEESCNIVSSLHNNSNLSPLSLTSNGYSNASSGCSTPIKARVNKNKNNNKLISELSDKRFDKIVLSEKLRYKKKRKSKQLCSMTGLPSNSIKRNSRLNLLGYSSENPAEKRAFHILSERQRRNDLKKLFETLRTNIPNLCDKQKASKLTILKAAVDHLMEVSNKKEKLSVIFDKEKQKNAILMQNLKNLQQSLNVSNGHSISNSNCYSHTKPGSTIATLFVH